MKPSARLKYAGVAILIIVLMWLFDEYMLPNIHTEYPVAIWVQYLLTVPFVFSLLAVIGVSTGGTVLRDTLGITLGAVAYMLLHLLHSGLSLHGLFFDRMVPALLGGVLLWLAVRK